MRSNIFGSKIFKFFVVLVLFTLTFAVLPTKKTYAAGKCTPGQNTDILTKEQLDLYAQPSDFKISTSKDKKGSNYVIRLMWKPPCAGDSFDFNNEMLKFAWWKVSNVSNSGVFDGYKIKKIDSQGNSTSQSFLKSAYSYTLATSNGYFNWDDTVPAPTSGTVNYQYSVSSIYDVKIAGIVWVTTYTPSTVIITQPLTANSASPTVSLETPQLSGKAEAEKDNKRWKITLGIKVQPGDVTIKLFHKSSAKSSNSNWADADNKPYTVDSNGNLTITKYETATGESRTVSYKVTAYYKQYESPAESNPWDFTIPADFTDSQGNVNQVESKKGTDTTSVTSSLDTTKPDSGNSQCPCQKSEAKWGLDQMFLTVICNMECAVAQAVIAIINWFQQIFANIPI